MREAQLLPSVDASSLTTQPLTAHEMSADVLDTHPGAGKGFDRASVETFGSLALAQQRTAACLNPQRPTGAAGVGHLGELREWFDGSLGLAAADGGEDQLGQAPIAEPHLLRMSAGVLGGSQSIPVVAEAVGEDRAGPVGRPQRQRVAARRCPARSSPQSRRGRLLGRLGQAAKIRAPYGGSSVPIASAASRTSWLSGGAAAMPRVRASDRSAV